MTPPLKNLQHFTSIFLSNYLKTLSLLLVCSFYLNGYGQNDLDSISQRIENEDSASKIASLQLKRAILFSKNEKEKALQDIEEALGHYKENSDQIGEVDSYITYGNLYFQLGKPKQAAHYDSLAYNLSEKITYSKGKAVALGNLGREYLTFGNFNKAEEHLITAISLEEKLKPLNKKRLAELYNRYSVAVASQGDYLESLSLSEKAIELSKDSKDEKSQAIIYANYANNLSRLTKYDKAVKIQFKVISLSEKLKDTMGLLRAYNNIGIAFRNAKEFDKAIVYYKKSIALAKLGANNKSLGLSYVNLATVYSQKEQFEAMDTLYEKGIHYFEEASDKGGIAFANHNYGNFLLITKKYTEADKRLLKAYNLRKEIGADLAAASSLSVLGKSAIEQKKWKEAEKYLLDAETVFKGKSRENRNLKELFGYLKTLYTEKGDFEKAFHYQTQELELERTLFTENEKVNTLKSEAAYERQKRELETRLTKKKQEAERLRMLFIGGIIFLILFFLVLSLWLRRKQLKERHEAQIISLDQEHKINLSKSLKDTEQQERKKIAHKLHDETGSMLSIAILNLKQFKKDAVKNDPSAIQKLETTQKLLVDISDNVRNISHSLMPIALEKYGLKPAIHDLINSVNTSQELKVEEIIEGLDDTSTWSEDYCITIYRIVQEVMNNIIKHAQASHVILQLVELEDAVTIYIEDNGKGINSTVSKDGVGLKMLKSNVEYLNGTIEINGNENKGTLVIAELPIVRKIA